MKLHYISNLKSSKTSEICITNLLKRKPRPSTFKDKTEYLAWASHEDTDHVFFSAVEGINPHIRVSKSNDAIKIHGIVADYDAAMTMEEAKEGIEKRRSTDYKPNHMSQTFSGGIRLIWEFEEPITFLNKRLYKKFVQHFVKHAKADKLLPGLDKCITDEHQYYELGTGWISFEKTETICVPLLQQILYESSEVGKGFSEGFPSLPIEAIQTGLEERYPGEWKNYRFGSRGRSFWIPGAVNPTSALMHPQGIQFFIEGGGFVHWGDERLLGASYVRKFQSNKIGGSVSNIYFDGKSYYSKDGKTDAWIPDGTEVVKRKLECNFGLSSRAINGMPSEVKLALTHIESNNRVQGIMPRLYSNEPMIYRDGLLYLNNNTCFACEMSDEPQSWGVNFPVTAKWLEQILHRCSPEQFDYLMAWMHYAYKHAKDGKPVKLPSLFLVGGTGIGKTLFSTFLMSKLLGGHSVATGYMTGAEPFNENLITTGLATVDDAEGTTSQSQRNKFSAILKKITANHSISYRKMYQGPMDVIWIGKIIVTLNTDPESMKSIPNLDMSNLDKVLVLKCADSIDKDVFTFTPDIEDIIMRELPYIAKYFYDYEPKKEVIGSSRFKIKAYVEPSILEESRSMSDEAPVLEIIDQWRDEYFEYESHVDDEFWHGSIVKLMQQIENMFSSEGGSRKVLEGTTNRSLTNVLKKLSSQGADWVKYESHGGKRGWKIFRPKG